jgi:hypothetical protein
MKTVQFNANNILCGNNYPIAYYYPMAKDLVIISTGHDNSIIDDSMGYSEYIIQLCHPDRHGGKESAVEITKKLLLLRT